jgi:hypothetical protein
LLASTNRSARGQGGKHRLPAAGRTRQRQRAAMAESTRPRPSRRLARAPPAPTCLESAQCSGHRGGRLASACSRSLIKTKPLTSRPLRLSRLRQDDRRGRPHRCRRCRAR